MPELSKRAAVEKSTKNVGVSTSARKYLRKTNPTFTKMRNADLNEVIATDFSVAQIAHRFILRSGEIAELRKSPHFYFLAVRRDNGQYDIIAIQPSMKSVPAPIRDLRLQPDWQPKK